MQERNDFIYILSISGFLILIIGGENSCGEVKRDVTYNRMDDFRKE